MYQRIRGILVVFEREVDQARRNLKTKITQLHQGDGMTIYLLRDSVI